ncbi:MULTISPECIES: HNH endonuclease [unclassified Streptomyces]|uniref:HNH endonuclease n=1 Tax=unclassified Streptomyces TaxID=2593676 RepID=UPI0033E4064F
MSGKRHLNSTMRRVRREQVARRYGWRCAYCRIPFARLDEVTLDHVVPVSLWRTWSARHLVAACGACNHAKGDRLPLSLALLLNASYGRPQSGADVPAPTGEHVHARVHKQRPDAPIDDQSTDWHAIDWRLLARLAHAHHAVFTATWTGGKAADPIGLRLMPDLRDEPRHARCDGTRQAVTPTPHGRPDCLRTARLVRGCGRPNGEAVPA